MCRLLPVIVGDPDIVGVTGHPTEDHSPLIVDSDAVAALQITVQRLQAIPGGRHQILKAARRIQHIELPQGYGPDISGQFADMLGLATMVKVLSGPVTERYDHPVSRARIIRVSRIPCKHVSGPADAGWAVLEGE